MEANNVLFLKENGIDVDNSLELLGDMELYNETLNDFYDEIFKKLENIKIYKDNGDPSNYAILAHSIKSDSKYLGFKKLAELAYEHELKGKENDINFINLNYDSFIKEANRIIDIVKIYLAK